MKKETVSIFLLLFLSLLLINIYLVSAIDAASSPATKAISDFWYEYIAMTPEEFTYFSDVPTSFFLIITVIGMIVFCSIVFEIAYLMPFSNFTCFIAAIGGIYVALAFKFFRGVLGILMYWIGAAVGIGGTIGMLFIGGIFILTALATYGGFAWAHGYLEKIRFNKEMASKTRKAYRAAANVSALNVEAAGVKFK